MRVCVRTHNVCVQYLPFPTHTPLLKCHADVTMAWKRRVLTLLDIHQGLARWLEEGKRKTAQPNDAEVGFRDGGTPSAADFTNRLWGKPRTGLIQAQLTSKSCHRDSPQVSKVRAYPAISHSLALGSFSLLPLVEAERGLGCPGQVQPGLHCGKWGSLCSSHLEQASTHDQSRRMLWRSNVGVG